MYGSASGASRIVGEPAMDTGSKGPAYDRQLLLCPSPSVAAGPKGSKRIQGPFEKTVICDYSTPVGGLKRCAHTLMQLGLILGTDRSVVQPGGSQQQSHAIFGATLFS